VADEQPGRHQEGCTFPDDDRVIGLKQWPTLQRWPGRYTRVHSVPDLPAALPADGPSSLIDQIVRDGARQMLAAALQAEVAAYVDQFAHLRDAEGHRLVVRNGTSEPRTVQVIAPRVNDKRTDRDYCS
jgi:hypothetical protein